MRESSVESYLHDEVEKAGGTTRKFKSPGRCNVPDRIVIWPGAWVSEAKRSRHPADVHFVECKAPGKKPRSGQVREHRRLRDLNCVVLIIDTKALVDAYVETWKR